MKKKLILLSAMLLIAAPTYAFEPYKDSAGLVGRLSDEESLPMLYVGHIVRDSKYEKLYGSSIKKFQSVKHCLKNSEQRTTHPDLTKFDWRKINNSEEAEVCIFRIATSYNDKTSMKTWLETQGFHSEMRSPSKKQIPKVHGDWSVEKQGVKFSSNFLNKLWIRFFVHSISIGITYKNLDAVSDVNVTLTKK